MRAPRLGSIAAPALAAVLVVGGLAVAPVAHAEISASQITTPADPSFFIADNAASGQTFAIAGTTTGSTSGDAVDIRCYTGPGSFIKVVSDVALNADGSFSVPNASLLLLEDGPCQLRAVPTGSTPSDLSPFSGPTIGVGERDNTAVAVGPNANKLYDYYVWGQQATAAFDYASLSSCGVYNGYLFSGFARTTTTFYCNGGLFVGDSLAAPTRAELQVDGANAYGPTTANDIDANGTGLPAVTDTYTLDAATGNLVIHETDPLVKCAEAAYPPTTASCATFVSTGVTDNRTITQDHDGHVTRLADSFTSTDNHSHSLDLLWDNSQRFQDGSGDSTQIEYEFPGETSFSTHAVDDSVSLPSGPGTIFVRMHGAADGDTSTGQGAIVYDRPATEARFIFVQSFVSEFTLHQTATIPAGGSTRFQFAYVQDYHAANVASLAQTAQTELLNTLTLAKKGKGKVTSSPGGIACGKTCTHGYAYGTSVTLKAKAARGSKFSGWSGACKGSHRCTIAVTADVSVKAKFVLEPCVVPNLVGKSLEAAKAAIRKAFCSVGKIRRVSSPAQSGRVVSQSPKRGKRVKQHTKIGLVVSKH